MGVKNTSLLLASKWKVKSVQNYCSRALQNYYYFFSLQNSIQDLLERTDDEQRVSFEILSTHSVCLAKFSIFGASFHYSKMIFLAKMSWQKALIDLRAIEKLLGKHEWAAAWQHQAGKTIKIWRVVPKLIMAGNSLSILHLNDSGLCLLPKRCVRAMQNGISIVDADARSIPI